MSTYYNLVCDHCRKIIHLGTRFAGSVVFGLSANDHEGREAAMNFICLHDGHPMGLRVINDDDTPNGYEDTTSYYKCQVIISREKADGS